jgi:hypothetical protein
MNLDLDPAELDMLRHAVAITKLSLESREQFIREKISTSTSDFDHEGWVRVLVSLLDEKEVLNRILRKAE